jgi:competence protein ComEC
MSLATGQLPPPSHPTVALFRNTGLAHLFAISGVNVVIFHSMLAAILRFAIWSARLRRGAPDIGLASSLAALPACWFYVLMAEAPIPAVRSAGMITAAVILWNVLGAGGAGSGFAVMFFLSAAISPFSLLTPSFLLSYTAVFFLVVSAGGGADSPNGGHDEERFSSRAKRWASSAVEASAVAFFGTLPISAAFFQGVPVTAIFWNLLFGPLLGTGGVAGASLAVAGGLTQFEFLEAPAGFVADALTSCIALLRSLSAGAAWCLPVPPSGPAAMAVATLSAAAGALLLRSKGRRAWPAPVISACLFMCWIHLPYAGLPDARLSLAALNVTKGACHVVFFPGGGTMVIDCGSEARGDSGRRVLVPYLRWAGVRRVDILVLSHPHEDHFGGAAALLAAMPVGEIWIPEGVAPQRFGQAVAPSDGRIRPVGKGHSITRGNARVEVRSAGDGAVSGGNGESLVIGLRYGRFSAWLPGDVEGGPAAWGPVAGGKEEVRVLFLPHHGSRGADPAGWISAASPDVSVIQNKNCLAGENLLTSTKFFALEIGALFVRTDGRTVLVGQEAAHPVWSRICRLD